jgi:nitrous oxidase accessory protein NosD
MKKLLLILLCLPMIGLGQNNLFVNILQNTVSICEGDTIDLIAIDSSFTASTGYNGPSWHVCQTGSDIHGDGSLINPFFTIQTAVDSASSGDSIFVAPGTYYESIFIYDKDLFLLGSGIQQTIIDAQNQNYGIKMYGSNVPDTSIIHIEGFTIINAGNGQGQGAGIFLNGNSPSTNTFIYSTILSCEIVFCNYGIKYSNASGTSTIKNNISRNNVIGLKTWYSGIYYIENNTIVENRDGYSGSGYLKNNIIANNTEYGISSTVPVSSFNNIWGNGYGSYPPISSVGDISVDPQFISSTDFNLLSTSPCIDAGDPDTDEME